MILAGSNLPDVVGPYEQSLDGAQVGSQSELDPLWAFVPVGGSIQSEHGLGVYDLAAGCGHLHHVGLLEGSVVQSGPKVQEIPYRSGRHQRGHLYEKAQVMVVDRCLSGDRQTEAGSLALAKVVEQAGHSPDPSQPARNPAEKVNWKY
jgi:hypothetical protein